MSERFPFITEFSERPGGLTPDQRRQAAAVFLGTTRQLLFKYEGGEEPNEVSDHPDAVTLHLHNPQAGELVIVDARRAPDGTVDDPAIALVGLAKNTVTENHQYVLSEDDGTVVRVEFDVTGTPEAPMWVPPEEIDGMGVHLARNVESGLYTPVNADHALQLQGIHL